MKNNTINKKNKNLSTLSTNSNSVGKNINKKTSPNIEKNQSDINSNKKSIGHANSQLNINSNKLTVKNKSNKNQNLKNTKKNNNNKPIIIDSELINIDNIDISSYNPDPYVLPKKKFEHNFYISKLENTVKEYNEIKEDVNKKILDTKIPNKAKNLQIRNFSLLEQLDKLNAILDTMIERKRFTKKKK